MHVFAMYRFYQGHAASFGELLSRSRLDLSNFKDYIFMNMTKVDLDFSPHFF